MLDVERVMGCVLCVMCCVLRVMCCVLGVMCCVTDIERTCRVSRKYVGIFPCPICMYLFEAPQQDMNVKREASPKSSPKGKDFYHPSLQGRAGVRLLRGRAASKRLIKWITYLSASQTGV